MIKNKQFRWMILISLSIFFSSIVLSRIFLSFINNKQVSIVISIISLLFSFSFGLFNVWFINRKFIATYIPQILVEASIKRGTKEDYHFREKHTISYISLAVQNLSSDIHISDLVIKIKLKKDGLFVFSKWLNYDRQRICSSIPPGGEAKSIIADEDWQNEKIKLSSDKWISDMNDLEKFLKENFPNHWKMKDEYEILEEPISLKFILNYQPGIFGIESVELTDYRKIIFVDEIDKLVITSK